MTGLGLLLMVAPVTAVVVAVALIAMHTVSRPVHATADTSQQYAGKSAESGSPVTVRGFSLANASALASLASRHHAAKRHVSHRHAAETATASPSGAVGTGDGSSWPSSVPGWRLTYSTDFPGSSLPSGWGAYAGEPGGDSFGNWEQSNVTVSGGALHLLATPSAQGGVSFYGNPQTYGMYLVRMKGDDEPGLSINNIAILWPAQQGVWPPEVDFYEDSGGTRQSFSASLHAGTSGDSGCCIVHSSSPANNGTAWHTYGVQWTPSSITYTIDGRVWGSVSRSSLSSPAQWPAIPMNLTLQSQNQASAQPGGTIETMTVAWVAEYAMSS
ncbi:MAG: glycoside hydrolase family 16 protein [Streptosporangiaceae bacterium]